MSKAEGILALCLGLLLPLPTCAETWTNRAGHVLTARLVAIEGGQIILEQTNGRTWRLPLTSLTPADQQRARAQTGTEPVPSELRVIFNQAEEDIRRAAQFLRGGKITREEYLARCETIRQRFDRFAHQALQDLGRPSDTAILTRLKQRLEQASASPAK